MNKNKKKKKIVDRYTEDLIKDLRKYRRREAKGLVNSQEKRNMNRRIANAKSRMAKASEELLNEANLAMEKLTSVNAYTLGVQRVLSDYNGRFEIYANDTIQDVFAKIQGASVFLNDPETAFLTGQRVTQNKMLKKKYEDLYGRLKTGDWKSNNELSESEMKKVFANYRRIEEENYSLISGNFGKEVYGSDNLILFMIEVRKQGGDELQAAHDLLQQFEIEQLPEYKDLVKMRGSKAKSISGLFNERGIYGRLGKLL